jgi:hypothetical protein
VRLVLAGIPRAIAQRMVLLIAVSAIATLAFAASALASAPNPLATASATTASATQTATQAVQGATQAATQAVPAAQPAVEAGADTVQPVSRVAESAVETATRGAANTRPAAPRPAPGEVVTQATRTVAATVDTVRSPAGGGPGSGAPDSGASPRGGADALGVDALRGTEPLTAAVEGALRSLGDTLRRVVPVNSLTAPVAALLADAGLLDFANLTDPLRLGFGRAALGDARFEGGPSLLGFDNPVPAAGALSATAAQPPLGTPPAGLRISQSASAQPPAAEAGGRPAGPPSPRKAPAPTAGGAATPSAGGLTFVPFLALLVLAALVAPKLMRRLEAAPALLRPALFACALERPG